MYTHKLRLRLAVLLCTIAVTPVYAEDGPALGEPVTDSEIAAVDFSVLPSGEGLPAGSGTAALGATVYQQNCLACHGEDGKQGVNDRLVGGVGSLLSDKPVRTVGSYWPYATTLFDYIRRAMPYQTPGSLSDDDVYSVSAYILHLNGIIGENDELNADTLPAIEMPNRDSVVWGYQPE